MLKESDITLSAELLEVIRFFNSKGWSPATSTNYSARTSDPTKYLISRSGVDKSVFAANDLILINSDAQIMPPFNKPHIASSAETEIHTALYAKFPEINCVLHTHSVLGTILSYELQAEKKITFEGLEILKGLSGNKTHLMSEILPITANSQDMNEILSELDPYLIGPLNIHGFLIAGHGLYSWGKDIATAKRHIETFEFLFECYFAMRKK